MSQNLRQGDDAMTTSADAPVLLEIADGIATVTLNRPKAMNALNPQPEAR